MVLGCFGWLIFDAVGCCFRFPSHYFALFDDLEHVSSGRCMPLVSLGCFCSSSPSHIWAATSPGAFCSTGSPLQRALKKISSACVLLWSSSTWSLFDLCNQLDSIPKLSLHRLFLAKKVKLTVKSISPYKSHIMAHRQFFVLCLSVCKLDQISNLQSSSSLFLQAFLEKCLKQFVRFISTSTSSAPSTHSTT